MVIHYRLLLFCVNTAPFFFLFSFLVHCVDVFQSTQRLLNFRQRKTIKTLNKNNIKHSKSDQLQTQVSCQISQPKTKAI